MNALRLIFVWLVLLAQSTGLHAQTVWHCSKQTALSDAEPLEAVATLAPEDTFQIASMSTNPGVIGITLRDLMDVYSGVPVRVSGRTLTACFQNDTSSATMDALDSLGLNPNTMAALARKSAIIRSQLQWVSTPEDMLRCMTRSHPSVGYFGEATDTDEVGPCF
jgi:hypothetical protein